MALFFRPSCFEYNHSIVIPLFSSSKIPHHVFKTLGDVVHCVVVWLVNITWRVGRVGWGEVTKGLIAVIMGAFTC